MRIGCLQFAPQVGDVDNNLNRADAVLSKANPKDLDLLVLPELAFSGYNFKSLQHITPFLEPTASGITSLWARTTALKYSCVVTVGYPEKVDVSKKWPTSPEYYNSAITVNREGETIANYRKSFLYYTDETWALEGPDGFFDGEIQGLGNVAMGICKWPTKSFERMDLNPYKFETPWSAWEFAYHILHKQANLVILSMAWLTREDVRSYTRTPKDPDMATLSYWLARLEPVIRAEDVGEIIVVLANRCGTENEAVYAGTSCVIGIDAGEVKLYGVLGRGERELLVIDTTNRPQAKLVVDEKVVEDGSVTKTSEKEPNHVPPPPLSPFVFRNESMAIRPQVEPVSPDEAQLSIDAMVMGSYAAISPVEPTCNHHYYAPERPKAEDVFAHLKSSINHPTTPVRKETPVPREITPFEDLQQYARPSSPKSRNASRTRMAVQQEPALANYDLANELEFVAIIDLKSAEMKVNSHSASEAVANTAWDNIDNLKPLDYSSSDRPKSTGW